MPSEKNKCQGEAITCGLFVAAHALIGMGAGLLLAERVEGRQRQIAGLAVLGVGAVAAAPLLVEIVIRKLHSAETSRNQRRRLRSIREGEGFNHETGGI